MYCIKANFLFAHTSTFNCAKFYLQIFLYVIILKQQCYINVTLGYFSSCCVLDGRQLNGDRMQKGVIRYIYYIPTQLSAILYIIFKSKNPGEFYV